MITLEQYYMGRDKTYASELTGELRTNAGITVTKANALLVMFGQDRGVHSGWRPKAVNQATPGAAKLSNHMICKAIDIADEDGKLDAYCVANQEILAGLGLWLENPDSTQGWCHVQTVAPHSGNRIFKP
jgi:hypothetical protein